jgi:hypothetical protein
LLAFTFTTWLLLRHESRSPHPAAPAPAGAKSDGTPRGSATAVDAAAGAFFDSVRNEISAMAKDFMRENKLTLSDGTFRARMIEIEDLGLARSERIDPLKKFYLESELGEKVAKLLLKFFDEFEAEQKEQQKVPG